MQTKARSIMCLQEVRRKGQGAKELGDRYKLLCSGGEDTKNGVGVIVNPEIKNRMVDAWKET